jgi:broad specificity phosphatase PhoE
MNQPVALLLRHSVRDDLPPGEAGNHVPITEIGRQLANELGERIGKRLCTLHTSPLIRCVQTAEALAYGAGSDAPIVRDTLLGDPGVFVIDGQRAWINWENLGHEAVMRHLVSSDDALPGMARPDPAARFLVHHMLSVAGNQAGLHLFVTHDSLVTATAARLLKTPLGPDDWPWYLEGVFFWRTNAGVQTAYRNLVNIQTPSPPCTLEEADGY